MPFFSTAKLWEEKEAREQMKLCEDVTRLGASQSRSRAWCFLVVFLLQLGKPQYSLQGHCRGAIVQLVVGLRQLCQHPQLCDRLLWGLVYP